MKMTFKRSGGFAGPAVEIKGEVVFDRDTVEVISGPDYERKLSDAEVCRLNEMIDKLPQRLAETNNEQRDQFQYDVEITSSSGHSRHLTLQPDTSPNVNQILDWVEQECERIWARRINK